MKKSLYKDEDWILQVISKLDSLKNMACRFVPQQIAESINETLFDVDVIFDFTFR